MQNRHAIHAVRVLIGEIVRITLLADDLASKVEAFLNSDSPASRAEMKKALDTYKEGR